MCEVYIKRQSGVGPARRREQRVRRVVMPPALTQRAPQNQEANGQGGPTRTDGSRQHHDPQAPRHQSSNPADTIAPPQASRMQQPAPEGGPGRTGESKGHEPPHPPQGRHAKDAGRAPRSATNPPPPPPPPPRTGPGPDRSPQPAVAEPRQPDTDPDKRGSCLRPCVATGARVPQPGRTSAPIPANIPPGPHPGSRFRGRTSLFKDQLTKGNASLQLTGVDFQDQGKYKCYTSTITGNKESFIDLHVEVPIHEVNIEQVGNRITCNSEGIYPEPKLTWSTSPPSALNPPETPKTNQNEQQLFSISSSLTVPLNVSNLVYRCTVSAGKSKRTAALLETMFIKRSQAETTIPCTSTNTPWKSLIWTFNHNQTILSWTRTDLPYTVSDRWKQQVKDVSETSDLILKGLSLDQMGTYTCKHSTEEETCVQNTILENEGPVSGSQTDIAAGVTVAVIILVAAAVFAGFCIYIKFIKGKKENGRKQTSDEGDKSSSRPTA